MQTLMQQLDKQTDCVVVVILGGFSGISHHKAIVEHGSLYFLDVRVESPQGYRRTWQPVLPGRKG